MTSKDVKIIQMNIGPYYLYCYKAESFRQKKHVRALPRGCRSGVAPCQAVLRGVADLQVFWGFVEESYGQSRNTHGSGQLCGGGGQVQSSVFP